MKNKKTLVSALLSLFTVPVVVIIILIDKPDYKFFNFIHRNIIPVAEGIGKIVSYPIVLIDKISDSMQKNKELLKESEENKKKLIILENIAVEADILRAENSLLRQKLNMASDMKGKEVFGKIIHNNSFLGSQKFIIKSDFSEVSEGNVVISNTGFLLGIITEKNGSLAKIRSLDDIKSNIPVRIAGTDVFGFLQGNGFSAPKMNFLSDGNFRPDPGMILITSGVNGNVPDGISVGRIDEVKGSQISVKLGSELKRQESAIILLFDKKNIYE